MKKMSVDETNECGRRRWIWMKEMSLNEENEEKNVDDRDEFKWRR